MATIDEWYSLSLRPRLDRAADRGDIARIKLDRLEDRMADLIASERLARPTPPARPVPPLRRRRS